MIFRTRKLIKHEDLNPRGSLFGGKCLLWADEEAAIYVMCQLGTKNVVTKLVSEINFVAPAKLGDVIEIGVEVVKFGITSISVRVVLRNKDTETIICDIENMVFVSVDDNGKSIPHGKTIAKYD